jgi:hypothetical protein
MPIQKENPRVADMKAKDPFTQYYKDQIERTYDCVDRIVLNAYNAYSVAPGGFRNWWREVHGGDENLDDAHIQRMAGRFSRRLRGWAKKHNIPVIYCKGDDRKHDLAQEYKTNNNGKEGIFAVFVSRATAPLWTVVRFGNNGMDIRKKKPMPFVNHFFFHIWDKEWGHLSIKMCSHPPFSAQIMLNGHEYVTCQAKRKGLSFTKEGNCYSYFRGTGLQQEAETLRSQDAVGHLHEVCDRWIYKCVSFGLDFESQHRSGFHYRYSHFQLEYCRNLIFKRGADLDRVFQGVIDRNRSKTDIKRLKTIFGNKHRPHHTKKRKPRFEVVLERPEYDLTVFKFHFGRCTVKMYSKGERVLRIEAVAHNTKELKCRRSLEYFPQAIELLVGFVEGFLENIQCIDIGWCDTTILDKLPLPSKMGKTRVAGIDPNRMRIRAAMEGIISLAVLPVGFKARELAEKVSQALGEDYDGRKAAYDLRKLRGKGMITKLKHSQRYRPTKKGLSAMVALGIIREKVLSPLIRQRGKLKGGPCINQTSLERCFKGLQREMAVLFRELRLNPIS